MIGATKITTASKNFNDLKNIGADYVIDYTENDIEEEILSITNQNGVEYMVDLISGIDIEQKAGIPKQLSTIHLQKLPESEKLR